eukprot:CAMPEP_0113461312 /NCGR_PEP_ID=MMETSP0014_2-20120614/11471_1 /TAXON_ID=2857 /ORGANISM="Nitzschia sp." /LENGTH=547 /DNA_ID=CAMNT_0000353059 /DNA_START=122 /DNA_END=1765 /DNA_ORIENTATION=- /assembly_acc=CAM_ASM_000159
MIRSVCCSSLLLLLLVLLLLLQPGTLQVAHAFPFNAGGCPRAVPAVQNSVHTDRNPQSNGFLEAGSLTVEIDGIALATGGNPIPLTSNEVHTISVTGGPSGTFRGILVRVEVASAELVAQAITNVFPPPPLEAITLGLQMDSDDINVIASSACNNEDNSDFSRLVEGLTHNNNDDKASMTGEVFMDWPAGPPGLAFPTTVNGRFDITVVVENTSGSSIYYHSGYDVAWTYQEGETGATDTGIAATVNIRPGCEQQGSQLAGECLGSTTLDFQQDCIDCVGQIAQSFSASVPGDSGSLPATAVGEERQDAVCDSLDFLACQTIRGCNAICGQTCSTEVESYGACVLSFERNDVGNPTCGPISCNADVPVTIPSSGGGTETESGTNTAPEPEPETTISSSPTVSAQPSSPSLTILVPPGSEFPSDQPSFVPSLQPSTLQSTEEEEEEEQEVVTPTTDAPTENTGTGGVSIEVDICVNQRCLISNGGSDCCATSPTCRTVGDPSEGVGQCVFTVGGATGGGGAGEREERPGSGPETRRQRVRRRTDAVVE